MKVRNRRKKTAFFILFLLFMVLAGGGFFFYNKIDKVTVKGCEYYTEKEMKEQVMRSIWDKNSFLLYLKYRYIGFEEIPFIEKITVKRVNNHEVVIQIYEKSLVACVKYMSQYIYFDKDGVVLETSTTLVDGIPCISGLNFSGFSVYEKMRVEEQDIFEEILEISQIIKRYKLEIEKIHFNQKNEVTLITGDIRVDLGKREFYDEPIAALSEILPTALEENLKGSISLEDYKYGDKVVFRTQS